MSTGQAYNPHGAALLDYWRGNSTATLICYQDGKRDDVPAAFWFRASFDPLEQLGLNLCRGTVLDVGAGTGIHAIELQRRDFEVTAIDIAAECIEIMIARGVRNTTTTDLYAFEGGPYDTIICLCNGLDKVGTLSDLPRFLRQMRSLLAQDGQLIVDSFDVRIGADAAVTGELRRKTNSGRYFGEMDMIFEYNGVRGTEFTVLQVDRETLALIAQQNGWRCEIVEQLGGHYLARLSPAT
ncbi:MAG: class I SAM-dependent methyltransferase [Hyphomicrobiaceae bacterium]